MTSSAVVLGFAAEFATLLVAVAAVAVVLLRPRLLGVDSRSRATLALGFLAVAVAAFLHGSLLYQTGDAPVVVVRAVGIVLLAVGALGLREDPSTRQVLWAALVLMAAAEVAALGASATVADGARAAAALGLGAVLLSSARRSIPARVALSTGATLLVVVLAISVALSVVISKDVEREALRRVEARADAEAQAITASSLQTATASATLIAASLQGSRLARLEELSRNPGPDPDGVGADIDRLIRARLLVSEGPVLYLTDQKKLIVTHGIQRVAAETVAGSAPVATAAAGGGTATGVVVAADARALAVGVAAITPGGRLVGLVVATNALDDNYLSTRSANDPNVSLALADRDGQVAGHGRHLPKAAVLKVARAALGPAGQASSVSGGAFLGAREVRSGNVNTGLVLVSSTPTSVVDDTRDSLFRTLFLVALVTALVAFLAALIVGERIGSGLRRLTMAAGGIRRGDFGARVDIDSQDELGVLGSTLNSMAASIQDLTTELRQNRDEEAALRGRLETVVAGMGEAVVAVDGGGRITTFNGAAEELFGVPASRAEGRPVGEVAHVASEDGTDLTSRLARPDRGRWREAAVVHRGDVEVPVALSAGGLPGPDSRVGGGVYVLRDMRREREAERAKADLLANISHELRTPLVPIKGYAVMLRRGRLAAAEARDAVKTISDAADQLERVVKRLLEVAAGDRAGALRLRPVRPGAVVESVVRRWKSGKGATHRIARRVARNLPESTVDRERLEEALDELMDNAVKFSTAGSRVLVGAHRDETDDGREAVALFVDDQGKGMTEAEMGRIFEDFAQADTSATRAVGGLGLGLSVVRRTVEAHGGELRCESEPGKGSRFSMVLPVAPRSDGDV